MSMERMHQPLSESVNSEGWEGTDISLFTGLDWQKLTLYGRIRQELSERYPKPEALREDDEDTVDVEKAKEDSKASLFLNALNRVHASLERVETLQYLASEYEKKVIRLYTHFTRNWPQFGKQYMKGLTNADLYELVESYFKILRKYGLSTDEEPYYFLTPKQKRAVKYEGEMLKRSTEMDESEIKVSLLEEIL
jgi:hypothetical protein